MRFLHTFTVNPETSDTVTSSTDKMAAAVSGQDRDTAGVDWPGSGDITPTFIARDVPVQITLLVARTNLR
jgi:hypothetical protein